jgi:hypothetical protein
MNLGTILKSICASIVFKDSVFKFGISGSDPLLSPFFYMHTPETLEFINSDAHTNTNKNMTFELLKVCRQQTRIELSCG